MFLLLSRSHQRRMTLFSRVVRLPSSLGPLAMLTATFTILNVPSDPDTAAFMGLPHPFSRMQLELWLPLREGSFCLNATGVVPNSNAFA
jgi:hypothetical protein